VQRRDPSRALVPLDGPSQSVVPDLVEHVIGYRQWRIHDGALCSVHTWDRWTAAVMTATCSAGADHDEPPPVNGCSCGFYARYTPVPRTASAATPDLVAGAVALWGRLELHAHGMRGQHARLLALALPITAGPKRRRVQEVAASLGVPAVLARRLQAEALRHGRPIPREMRPPDLEPNKRKAPGTPDPARLHARTDRGRKG
jgi:hypothetical protein